MIRASFISAHLHLLDLLLNSTNEQVGLCDSERASIITFGLKTGYYEFLCKVITSMVCSHLHPKGQKHRLIIIVG